MGERAAHTPYVQRELARLCTYGYIQKSENALLFIILRQYQFSIHRHLPRVGSEYYISRAWRAFWNISNRNNNNNNKIFFLLDKHIHSHRSVQRNGNNKKKERERKKTTTTTNNPNQTTFFRGVLIEYVCVVCDT